MASRTLKYCSRCGRALAAGKTAYLVTIGVTADFDGTLDPPEGKAGTDRVWREIEGMSEEELMNDVTRRLGFILCKPCRDEWIASPFGGSVSDDRAEGTVH